MLQDLTADGVAGLAPLTLELGPLTALIGPRGSGKSQLLASIAWLVGAGPAPAGARPAVSATVRVNGRERTIRRRAGGGRFRRDASAPSTSFLRARDRLGGTGRSARGAIARALSARVERPVSSDAEAAEAMVGSIERCCLEGVVGELLLIEEPEMMLTPQAARYLSSLLHRFADAGNQVVYSTWSPAFVDAVHAEEIVRLDLQPAGSVVRRARRAPLTEEQGLRITAEFDHERSEVFFARSVVLAEGRTERFALPLVFRQLGHDMDAEGIAMCEVGGKANLPPVVRVLTDLGIPCVVAYDTDGGRDADLDARVRAAAGEGWAVALDPDFEAVAGIGTRDEKVLAAWRRFSAARPEEIPEPLRRVVELAISPLT